MKAEGSCNSSLIDLLGAVGPPRCFGVRASDEELGSYKGRQRRCMNESGVCYSEIVSDASYCTVCTSLSGILWKGPFCSKFEKHFHASFPSHPKARFSSRLKTDRPDSHH